MSRTSIFAAAAAALLLAAPGAGVHADAVEPRDSATDTDSDVEPMRLECRVRAADTGSVVRCDWSPPSTHAAAGIRLHRLAPAVDDHRRVIYRSGDTTVTGFTDVHVRPGHHYAYVVTAVDQHGRTVARSRAEWVRVPAAEIEVLRLDCNLGPAAEAIGCEWSVPQSADAWVVSLWRSVDGGPRELVERFRPSGPNAYRDPVPAGANRVVYAVIVTNESDAIVARSRPSGVRIPPSDMAARDRLRRENAAS